MRRLVAGLAAGIALAAPIAALAHSILLEATPPVGRTVRPPSRVTLRFNNRIEKRLSRVTLVDSDRTRHGLAVLVSEGATDTLAVLAPPLAPGRYQVEWQVLSTDGHIVSGRFPFQVAP